MNKDRKLVFGILVLLVSIVAVSISYAAFTQNLNINGTANVQATNWSVHFANLTNGVRNGTASEVVAPTIKASRTDIRDYSVKFFTPGDSITYKFDVVNDGDYDAKISVLTKGTPTCSGSDVTSNTNVCNNLEYNLFYTTNGKPVTSNDTLYINESKNMTLVLRYKSSIEQGQLPTAEVTVSNLGITIQYEQISAAINEHIYEKVAVNVITRTKDGQIYSGGIFIPESDDQIGIEGWMYMAVNGLDFPIYYAKIHGNGDTGFSSETLLSANVGIVYNNHTYLFEGADGGTAYSSNKDKLNDIFGSDKCMVYNYNQSGEYYECNSDGFLIKTYANGDVIAETSEISCTLSRPSDDYCYLSSD